MASITEFFKTLFAPFKLFFGDPDRDRILRDGRSAVATIVNLGESGIGTMTVNDQPYVKMELEIYEEGKPKYNTTLSTVIPRLAVPQFQPGATIKVKIDPLDPMKVVFDTSPTAIDKPAVGNTDQTPIKDGKHGMAEVMGIAKTDKTKNGNPVYKLTLKITGEKIETYTFDKEVPLPDFAIAKFTVGKTYSAVIDSEDKTKVVMDIV